MPFAARAQLEDALVRMSLVPATELKLLHQQFGRGMSVEQTLDALEKANLLTGYQLAKLRKGSTEGLRLGPYKLLYQNAAGSFARVFRAAVAATGEIIGIKLLRQRYAQDPRTLQHFYREAELGKRLKHKNIVPIYDVAADGNQHYITMEFVEGGNFRDFLKIRQKFSPDEATRYVIDIAQGLQYALSLGYTHRDLKLTNVLLSAQGVAKLVDFGLAGRDAVGMTDEVDRAIEYATLEKGSDAPENDARSDLYFLGAIYYELLTGQPPYPSTRDREERKQFSRYRNVRPVRAIDPGLPNSIADIVTRLMDVNPWHRYQTPTDVLHDLTALGRNERGGLPRSPSGSSSTAFERPAPLTAPAPPASVVPVSLVAPVGPASPVATSADSTNAAALPPGQPTVLILEQRPKQQNALRDYFSKHGWRVLMLTTPERAIARAQQTPITAVVMMGDALGDDIFAIYEQLLQACQSRGIALVGVLPAKLQGFASRLPATPLARVLVQPVSLRDIRSQIEILTQPEEALIDHDAVDDEIPAEDTALDESSDEYPVASE